ncbi:vesicle-associated protein 2-2 isoform X2 [Olea europaea var. sylvestris]|uniref:Vesicle-associated 2-2-like n=1 Tax=Olea europaea subsp. europaea TaxID=158383 RepID=A0A8S0SGU8_OLEEU|nr:vesicle-associated protein 2-2 isoform X2 [Olea europaea var. sylvestris]CAA2991505.1 vesicle-associated 2-2-like [Olea europaea subsp. europaea]
MIYHCNIYIIYICNSSSLTFPSPSLVEVKKQSTCSVHLTNLSDQYVAFKVKTTSPKKYCVRPNVGLIKPNSTCDFIVTMQAQKSAPDDMQCKDKFLIQHTIVPYGTAEEEITSGMFVKDGDKYIEETKLRVVLTSPPHSPMLLPVDGILKHEQPSIDTSVPKDKLQSRAENLPSSQTLVKNIKDAKIISHTEDHILPNVVEDVKSVPARKDKLKPDKDKDFKPDTYDESRQVKDVEETKLKFTNDIEELKSKMTALDSKLIEAQDTISKLKEERSSTIHEKEILKQELVTLRRKTGTRKVQVGFPPLFVCMVALISLIVGFLLRA